MKKYLNLLLVVVAFMIGHASCQKSGEKVIGYDVKMSDDFQKGIVPEERWKLTKKPTLEKVLLILLNCLMKKFYLLFDFHLNR